MTKAWAAILALLLTGGLATLAVAQEAPKSEAPAVEAPKAEAPPAAVSKAEEKPGIVAEDILLVKATVEAIDYAKRKVTLKGADGESLTVKVPEDVQNLDQVKVGDEIMVDYYEALAVYVQKPSGGAEVEGAAGVVTAPEGEKPAALAGETVEIKAKVLAVDCAKRKVTLEGLAGEKKTFKVPKDVEKLDEVKVGDEVVVRYTEALAVAVTKPEAAPKTGGEVPPEK